MNVWYNILMKQRNNAITIRIFVGVSKSKQTKDRATYALTLDDSNGNFLKMPPEQVYTVGRTITNHYVLLSALYKAITILSENISGDLTLIFHCDDDRIAFEWGTEYKEDHKFSVQTQDRDLWERIAKAVKGKGINLVICGNDSVLSAMSKIERRRARNDIRNYCRNQ